MRNKERSLLFVINEISRLTPTELEILHMLYMGKRQKDVVRERCLEISTIKFHVNNILKKLNFKTIRALNVTLRELKIFEVFMITKGMSDKND